MKTLKIMNKSVMLDVALLFGCLTFLANQLFVQKSLWPMWQMDSVSVARSLAMKVQMLAVCILTVLSTKVPNCLVY